MNKEINVGLLAHRLAQIYDRPQYDILNDIFVEEVKIRFTNYINAKGLNSYYYLAIGKVQEQYEIEQKFINSKNPYGVLSMRNIIKMNKDFDLDTE